MKIVNRKEFLALSPGTLYQKYKPCFCEGLEIKFNNVNDNDWAVLHLDAIALVPAGDPNAVDALLDANTGFRIDCSNIARDGCFDADQQFMIWEKEDIKDLIDLLVHDCL